QDHDPQLEELIPKLDCNGLDLILVEGFKHAAYPKLEVYRDVVSHSPLYVDDPQIIALITELPTDIDAELSLLDINNPPAIADFIEAFIQQNPG
ncbi:MAG: molybdopterin-guanine dinucleotide biosynthesis protein MobB, partial [Pseudomonadota bacterium]|nr:molybdopterin-guanine dinucleotide biosynthesis protein MobB [Pseudomonadota bacterium]